MEQKYDRVSSDLLNAFTNMLACRMGAVHQAEHEARLTLERTSLAADLGAAADAGGGGELVAIVDFLLSLKEVEAEHVPRLAQVPAAHVAVAAHFACQWGCICANRGTAS